MTLCTPLSRYMRCPRLMLFQLENQNQEYFPKLSDLSDVARFSFFVGRVCSLCRSVCTCDLQANCNKSRYQDGFLSLFCHDNLLHF